MATVLFIALALVLLTAIGRSVVPVTERRPLTGEGVAADVTRGLRALVGPTLREPALNAQLEELRPSQR
ncbi:hypothetical protein [Thalassiella azotivora]